MTRAKGWLHVLAAALAVGLLACSGSSFCPNCTTAIPVASVGYPDPLPELVRGTACTLQPTPHGGLPSNYLLVSGTLPGGLALNPTTGVISGTPNQAGVFRVSIQATNPTGGTDQALTFLVRPPGDFTVTYQTGLTFPANAQIPPQVPTLGNAIPGLATAYSLGATTLPPGLALGTDGAITGTPTTVGADYGFTVTATNGARTAAFDVTYTIAPAGSLTLNYFNIPAATTVGTALGPLAPTISNATPGVSTTYAVTTGTLPPGLVINHTTGALSGTPTAAASYGFTVTASNGTRHADAALTILVVAVPTAASLVPSTTSPGYGAKVTLTPTFAGGAATIGTTGIGSSDVAAAATSGTAVTSGPVTAATTFTLTVTNLANTTATTGCTVTPQTVAVGPVTPATPVVTAGFTRAFSATATGGLNNTLTWTATGGSFIGSTWTAPGTPGTYTITATSVDDPSKKATATATVVAVPTASLAVSTTTPAYGATVTVTPTFAGGTATLGTGGTGSSNLTASAVSGTGYTSAAITASTTFTLTVTNGADTPDVVTAARTAAPSSVSITAIAPANPSLLGGQSVTFSATASGGSLNTLAWSASGPGGAGSWSGTTWTAPAATGAYTITATSNDNATVKVTTTATVVAAPSLAANPNSNPLYGGSVGLIPTFSGGTAVIGTGGQGSSNIASNVTSTNSYPSGAITAGTTFTLTVSLAGGNVATAPVTVTPQTVTIDTISPLTSTGGPGSILFTSAVHGASNSTINWTATGPGGTGSWSGSTWTSPTGAGSAGTYTITATSAALTSVKTTATYTVSAPTGVSVSGGGTVCPGASSSVQVSATYATSYQWLLNGSPVSGATGTTYTIGSAGPGTTGTYTCQAINGAGTTTSSGSVQVATYAALVVPTPGFSGPNADTSYDLSISATGTAPLSYQWYNGSGTTAPGASTSSTYNTGPLNGAGATYYVIVTDHCTSLQSPSVDLNGGGGNAAPVITSQPSAIDAAASGTSGITSLAVAAPLDAAPAAPANTLSVTAAGPGPLAYQWFRIPAGSGATGLQNPVGDGSATLALDAGATQPANDGDRYFVLVSNPSGQAVSALAPLAVGNGILLQASGQPRDAFAASGAAASFTVTAASADPGALQYQWYVCAPGATAFAAVPGATAATWTLPAVQAGASGSLYRCVVTSLDPGVRAAATRAAALFVDTPGTLGGLADGWQLNGDAVVSGSGLQLCAAAPDQAGSAFWPQPVSTARLTLAFTVAVDQPSPVPGDGFALVFADPSGGATAASLGASGSGLGARGIPGAVLAFDTLANAAQGVPGQAGYLPADLPVPFLGLGRAEADLWGQPWRLGCFALPGYPGSRTDPAPAIRFATATHAWRVTVADGVLSVTLDGAPALSGAVDLPPAALVGFTAATSANWERVVVSDFSATLSAP